MNYLYMRRVSLTFLICASFQSIKCCCFSLRNEINTAMYIGSMQKENYISIPVVDQDWIVWIRINVILQRWKSNDVLVFCILDRHFVRQVILHVQTFYESTPLRLSLWAARWHPTGAHERTKRRDERCRVCFREFHSCTLHFAFKIAKLGFLYLHSEWPPFWRLKEEDLKYNLAGNTKQASSPVHGFD